MSSQQRWVVKIGSALLTDQGRGLATARIQDWAAQLAGLRARGIQVVLVSSGAVAAGMVRMGWKKRPTALDTLQAAAAIGQLDVVQAWADALATHDTHAAQVLLTHDDMADRRRYLNARSTLQRLLALGVVPVVNENDTVATDEIRLGDNDRLAALTTGLVDAQRMIILTDQLGLMSADPRCNPDASLITEAKLDDPMLAAMAGAGRGHLGRGGMRTKLLAAELAGASGASTVIVGGDQPDVLIRLAQGEPRGTLLQPAIAAVPARKRWLAAGATVSGVVTLDAGAVAAVRARGRSVLPVGVTAVSGDFGRGDLVECVGPDGVAIARGLSNYAAQDAARLCGKSSEDIADVLGAPGDAELIHRDNLALI